MNRLVIETVGFCNLSCKMCPTRNYDTGKEAMTEKVFQEILNILRTTSVLGIDLTGWGEPLLDPNLEKKILSIKQIEEKALVGFTSNGTLFTNERITSVLNTGLDWISISFDAASKEAYEKIRVNSNYETVIENLRFLSSTRVRKKTRLNAVCVVMKENIREMDHFINLFFELGFDGVTFKPLDVISSKNNLPLVAEKKAIYDSFLDLKEKYKDQIIVESWNLINSKFGNDCLAMAASGSIFVNCLGDVSPCCYLGHHVPNVKGGFLFRHVEKDKFYSFANILRKSLAEIIKSDQYADFLTDFRKGYLPSPCSGCRLVNENFQARSVRE